MLLFFMLSISSLLVRLENVSNVIRITLLR